MLERLMKKSRRDRTALKAQCPIRLRDGKSASVAEMFEPSARMGAPAYSV